MGPAFHYQAFAMIATACAVFLWPLYLLNRHQPAMRPWLWASLCLPVGTILLPLQLQGDVWWGVTFANHCLLLWNIFTVIGLLLYCGWDEGRVWRLMITLFLLISLPFNYFTWVDFDTRSRILIFSLMYILLYGIGATVLWQRFGLRTGRYGVNLLFAMCSLMAVIMVLRVPAVLFDVSFDSILEGRLINLIVSSVGYFVAYGLVLSFALLMQEDRQLELQLLQQQAQHNAAVKSHFLATLSHELRTPLNAITGIAEKLQNDCHDAMQKQDCSLIIDQAMGLSKLARDVLMQSEQEHSEISRPQQAVMLNHWLRCLIAGLQPVVQRPNVLLELICHTDLGCRQIDSVRLRQTLTNLIGNAIKYTQQGSIRLQVTAVDEGRIRFDVEDTGCGLAAEDIPRLLQPFTRADSAREQEGSGLGLSLAQQWLRQMGSQLDCVSWPGVGSRFGFTLALEPADVQLEDPVSVENSSVDIALSVLVVEDVLLNRELVVNQLRQMGHWVASVASLAEARLHRQQHHVDVILLDMNLPDGDGLSLLPWLKQQQLDSKVIAFTADSSPRRLQQLQQSGLDGVVNKPVTQNMLKAALQPLQLAVADPIIDRLQLSQTRRHIPETQWPQQLEQALQRLQQETPISVDDEQWRAKVHRIASQSSSLGLQRLRLLALELLDQTEQIESYQCVRLQQLLLFSIECLKEQSHAGIRNTDTLTVAGG